jgi:hypothetical protein
MYEELKVRQPVPKVMRSLDPGSLAETKGSFALDESSIDFRNVSKQTSMHRLMNSIQRGVDLDFATLERMDEKSTRYLKRTNIGLPQIFPSTTKHMMSTGASVFR